VFYIKKIFQQFTGFAGDRPLDEFGTFQEPPQDFSLFRNGFGLAGGQEGFAEDAPTFQGAQGRTQPAIEVFAEQGQAAAIQGQDG